MPDELTQDEKFKLRKILYHVYDEELRADRDTEIACLHEDIAQLRQQLAERDAEIERLDRICIKASSNYLPPIC